MHEKHACLREWMSRGSFGRSALQTLILSPAWHPIGVTDDGKEAVNWEDDSVVQIETCYPGLGVASLRVSCWQELQCFNASDGVRSSNNHANVYVCCLRLTGSVCSCSIR